MSRRVTGKKKTFSRDITKFKFEDLTATRTDFSAVAGGDLRYTIGIGQLLLDVRYYLGLLNTETGEEAISDLFNRSFNVSVGYAIPITNND